MQKKSNYKLSPIMESFGMTGSNQDLISTLEGEIRRLRSVVAAADQLLSINEDDKIKGGEHRGA